MQFCVNYMVVKYSVILKFFIAFYEFFYEFFIVKN